MRLNALEMTGTGSVLVLMAAIAFTAIGCGVTSENERDSMVEDDAAFETSADEVASFDPSSLGYLSEESRREVLTFMREKTGLSSALLEGLRDHDLEKIRQSLEALRQISLKSEWMARGSGDYSLYSERFRDALDLMDGSVEEDDLVSFPGHYVAMTASCIGCHSLIERPGPITDRASQQR